jgi:hypothetical protein
MRKTRVITGLILSLMIFSQSVLAVSASCALMIPPYDHVVADTNADPHAGHHMEADQIGDESDTCCKGGYCSLGGCLSLSAIYSTELTVPVTVPRRPSGMDPHAPPFRSLDSLYRPPIVI